MGSFKENMKTGYTADQGFSEKLKRAVRDVPNYPSPGILFKDITPILADPGLMREIVIEFSKQLKPYNFDAIAAVEARGFIFGSILAHELNCRFVPVRKAGKLPYTKRSMEYALEYGNASIEIHDDAIQPGWKVLIHDDLLATGGTAAAAATLIKGFDAQVAGFSFLINLGFLPGESNLVNQFGVKPQYLISY